MKPLKDTPVSGFFKEKTLFYQTLASIKTPEEMSQFLSELLTQSELRMLHHRWIVGRLITRGGAIRTIAGAVGMGTDTVGRIKRRLLKENSVLKKWLSHWL